MGAETVHRANNEDPKEKLSEKQCKVCGSRKWVCYSNNFGQDWYCWGHRPEATEEQRRREDERRKEKRVRKVT